MTDEMMSLRTAPVFFADNIEMVKGRRDTAADLASGFR
jgi:hypothetical protein